MINKDLENITEIEIKAEICKKWKNKPAVWAFERNGRYYCFFANAKPSCASDDSEILEMRYQNASTGGEVVTVIERHYECPIKAKFKENQ